MDLSAHEDDPNSLGKDDKLKNVSGQGNGYLDSSSSSNFSEERSLCSENPGHSSYSHTQKGRSPSSEIYGQSPSDNPQKSRSPLSENYGQSSSDNKQTGQSPQSADYDQSPSNNMPEVRSPQPENYLNFFCVTSRKKDKYGRYRYYQARKKIVQEFYNKQKPIAPPPEGWALPRPETMFTKSHWTKRKFLILKSRLNNVKSKLNYYCINEWHRHTNFMTKGGKVLPNVRSLIRPELLTQAWCKFYEIVMEHKLIPSMADENGSLVSIHLCEAPGSFITSLNHYLKLNHPNIEWKWLATSLNPYYEGNSLSNMFDDDRLIIKTTDCWSFGLDYTGDLMQLHNLDHLLQLTGKMGKVLLVTADGSINCQDDPAEQENLVSSLLYCETVAALHILATGGSFLMKTFTMYEEPTISLIYLLCNVFNSVTVKKPVTSKEGNSEVYVVCLGFKGYDFVKPYLPVLRRHYGPSRPQAAMFRKKDIPASFFKTLFDVAEYFMQFQAYEIKGSIDTFENDVPYSDCFMPHTLRAMVADEFIARYDLRKIDEKDRVVEKSRFKSICTLSFGPRINEGSFYEQCQRKKLGAIERLNLHKADADAIIARWPFKENAIGWLTFSEYVDGFSMQVGKPVTTIHYSVFCLEQILGIRNEVQTTAKQLSLNLSVLKHLEFTEFLYWLGNELNLHQYKNKELRVANFNGKLGTLSPDDFKSNGQFEVYCFKVIMKFINEASRGQNFLMIDYPMLTQFNVGVIYFMCHMFERVGFVKPRGQNYAIFFQKFREWHPVMEKQFKTIVDMVDTLKKKGNKEAVLALFHISKLCGQFGDDQENNVNIDGSIEPNGVTDTEEEYTLYDGQTKFYQCVTEINITCVKEKVLDIIDFAIESDKKK